MWLVLAGCLHLGVAPPRSTWSVAEVRAPVAEPGVGDALRSALLADLSAGRALDPAAPALRVEVVAADWVPARRSGDVLAYDLSLRVRVEAGERTWESRAETSLLDPGPGGAAPEARARAFEALAAQVSREIVARLR